MAGNRESGIKTYHTLVKRYGTTPDGKSRHHAAIGKLGGSAPKKTPSGFKAMDPEKVREAGRKGGATSKRRLSAEQIERQSVLMKARWAAKRAEQA